MATQQELNKESQSLAEVLDKLGVNGLEDSIHVRKQNLAHQRTIDATESRGAYANLASPNRSSPALGNGRDRSGLGSRVSLPGIEGRGGPTDIDSHGNDDRHSHNGRGGRGQFSGQRKEDSNRSGDGSKTKCAVHSYNRDGHTVLQGHRFDEAEDKAQKVEPKSQTTGPS